LVFANSNPNVLVTISLIDPDGNVVKGKGGKINMKLYLEPVEN